MSKMTPIVVPANRNENVNPPPFIRLDNRTTALGCRRSRTVGLLGNAEPVRAAAPRGQRLLLDDARVATECPDALRRTGDGLLCLTSFTLQLGVGEASRPAGRVEIGKSLASACQRRCRQAEGVGPLPLLPAHPGNYSRTFVRSTISTLALRRRPKNRLKKNF